MLVEIAIKNLLQKMQAKAFESTFFKMDPLIIQSGLIADREDAIRTFELDYRDYEWYLNKFISIKENDEADRFKIIFRSVLNYEVSIATQECFTIYKDRDGNAINNPYLGDSERVQVVHLCVFPFEGKTTVLLFYYYEDTSYDILKQQFENSSYDINLRYINYYMLALGENYFYSGEIKKELFSDPALKKISREYIGERGNFGITSEISKRRVYTPVQYDGIPFLLDRIYSLDNC